MQLYRLTSVGAQVILSRLAIGDLATQYFADRGLFCAGRVPGEDMHRVSKATGGQIQTSTNTIKESMLGTCGYFEVHSTPRSLNLGCRKSKLEVNDTISSQVVLQQRLQQSSYVVV